MRIVQPCLAVLIAALGTFAARAEGLPNILWLSTEDISANLGCYGDPDAVTPTLDKMAAEGVRYTKVFTAAPVCAPNRASIITGRYQGTTGAMHMRSKGEGSKQTPEPKQPPDFRCFPEYLRNAGYYCTNNAKEDYNFGKTPPETWDDSSGKAHWKNRPDPKQPFFAVFNFNGTHESQVRLTGAALARATDGLAENERHDPAKITVPPHHPDTPLVRAQWANYHDLISTLDHWVADHLKALDEAGLAENTIVMFWSDHGAGLPRHKRWLYDSGTHIPVIVRVPKAMQGKLGVTPGMVNDHLISSVDFAPTVLGLAGVATPAGFQGQPFLGENLPAPRAYAYSARDRMDERYDTIRSVRDARFRYIRNYQPWVPFSQYIDYCERGDIQKELRRLKAENALPPGCQWFALPQKPVEELYDTAADPWSLNNLASDPAHAADLERLRKAGATWIRDAHDLGFLPEAELVRLENKYGGRAAIYDGLQKDAPGFWERLYATAELASDVDSADTAALRDALGDPQAAIRYWAVVGLGRAEAFGDTEANALDAAAKDPAPEVRVAAAEALLRHGRDEAAQLAALTGLLADDDMWIRVLAATALDMAGEKARPAVPALREALNDPYNKYVVRLANHALNELLGAKEEVP